jgi:hypothetical protein
VWIATAAVNAREWQAAEAVAAALFETVAKLRAEFGDRLDWVDRGAALWQRARSATPDVEGASALVRAHSAYAYLKHWAHTTAGHVALHRGQLEDAAGHLAASAAVVADARLSSYGPARSLARELCDRGRWPEVEVYLRACAQFWHDERLELWIALVARQENPFDQEQ